MLTPSRVTIFSLGLTGGQLFFAIFAGVVLAYCFQWLLTNLSVAIGASAFQGMTDPEKRKGRRGRRSGSQGESSRSGSEDRRSPAERTAWGGKAVKIESGVGIWATVTSAIALYLACWLAMELVRVQGAGQGVIMGLIIWSVFLATMLYLEAAAMSSLLGVLTGAVRQGVGALLLPLKAAAAPIKAAAGKISDSREASAERERSVETAQEIAEAVRKELFGDEDAHGVERGKGSGSEGGSLMGRIRDFVVSGVKPMAMDAARVGREMKAVFTDPEIVEAAKRGELQDMDRSRFAEIVAGRTDLDRDQAERLTDALHSSWGRFILENTSTVAGAAATVAPLATSPASGAAPKGLADRYRQFKEFLRSTGREELQPERLEAAVKTLVQDPGAGLSELKLYAQELDRDAVAQALSRRQDLTPEEANRIADQVEAARGKALSSKEEAEHRLQQTRDRTTARIRDQVYSMDLDNKPGLEGFQGDFMKLFEDPKAGYEALKRRLQGLDREGLISLLSAPQNMDREDAAKAVEKGEAVKAKAEQAVSQVKDKAGHAVDQARAGVEKMVDRILEARDTALDRARQVEEETKRRLEEAREMAMEQAESARKATAAAAWWLLAAAIVSGAAAALGGLTAAGT